MLTFKLNINQQTFNNNSTTAEKSFKNKLAVIHLKK